MYRQGDVLLVPIVKLPDKPGPVQLRDEQCRIILAAGEATGHAHAIDHLSARLRGADLSRRFLEVLAEGGVDLTHEEHATIHLPKGIYRVIRQQEWFYEANRTLGGYSRWVMD